MSYREAGTGRPVLLLHGNPTSSYLWRHLLARAAAGDDGGCRWIAPDLIGMGESGKPDLAYRLVDHIAYVNAFIDELGLSELVLVGHDWGVAIAISRLRQSPRTVRGVAIMEGHLRPLASWDDLDVGGRQLFQQLRTPGLGEQMVLDDNFFVETLLPAGLIEPLDGVASEVYRSPYPTPASRLPLLQWARQIPVAGDPADVAQLMTAGAAALQATATPTLLIHGEPGVLVTADTVAWCRDRMQNLTIRSVGGPAGHFLPEDRPERVTDELIAWAQSLP